MVLRQEEIVKWMLEHEQPIFITITPCVIYLNLFTRNNQTLILSDNETTYIKVLNYFSKYNNGHFVRYKPSILK